MSRLTDPKHIKEILARNGIVLTKARGQNFLTNPSVCPQMADMCGATEEDGIIEIGPGVGVLTEQLAQISKKTVAIELDSGLIPVLAETLSQYENVKVIHGDALKIDLKKLIEDEFDGGEVYLCANLPYYITTPILMKLLEDRIPLKAITVMVQKEFADRICAKVGSRQSGAVTAAVAYYAECERLFRVSPGSFFPPPKVESEVIRLVPHKNPPVDVKNEKHFFSVIKAGFAQRRKTLTNALLSGANVPKETTAKALEEMGLSAGARIEELSLSQIGELSNLVFEI